jgi:hypothetical protein
MHYPGLGKLGGVIDPALLSSLLDANERAQRWEDAQRALAMERARKYGDDGRLPVRGETAGAVGLWWWR